LIPLERLRLKRHRLAEAPGISLVVKSPVSSLRPFRPSQHGIRRHHHQESFRRRSAAELWRDKKGIEGKAILGVSSLFSAVAEGEEVRRSITRSSAVALRYGGTSSRREGRPCDAP
jgi:hypothetical protein